MARLLEELSLLRAEVERLYSSRDSLDGNFTPVQQVRYGQLVDRERTLLHSLHAG